jgi:hypothetical protein
MPPRPTAYDFRSRAWVVAVVIGGHVAMLLPLLSAHREPERAAESDERMLLVFIDPLDKVRAAPEADPSTRLPRTPRASAPPPAEAARATDASAAISPGVDWYANGSDAARRAATAPTTRDFAFPRHEPPPRERRPFAWDKVHTERVHALDGGGIGVRLSDNCELVIAPFPLAGCVLGKRQARGDLFDEMKAPPDMGDWK